MANKRVIDMQELSELGDGWYTFLDSATGGTKKFDMGNMLNATADAQDAAEAAQSAATSAREAADGVVSPTVTPSQITGGTRVTITDVDGTRTFDVMDGPQGEKGDTGDPAAPGSITTDMLADGAVTPDKLAPGVADGYQPALVAGSSRAMLGDAETASWTERTTAADGAALIESVYGRTLKWNQLITVKARTSTASNVNYTGNADGTVTISGTASGADVFNLDSSSPVPVIQGHKYVIRGGNTEKHVLIIVPNLFAYGNPDVIHTATDTAYNQPASIYFGASFTGEYTCKPQLFDLTAMFGAGNEPSTVAEFEALYPNTYYPYDPGSLLPVRMEGIETVGFNQWDEEWVNGNINEDGTQSTYAGGPVRSKNYIPVFPSTTYYCKQFAASNQTLYSIYCYDAGKSYIGIVNYSADGIFTTLAGTHYIMFRMYNAYGTAYNHDICINISDPSRNGEYEPYWSSERTIPAATYFPQGLRSAGSVYDELRADAAVTRVGERAYQSGDESDASVITDGTVTYYALATPTTTPIDPPLPMSYRVGAGGTERVMIASGTTSAPPIFATRYPLDPADLAASIAPRESATAEANHAVGDLVMLGFTLCKVTTAIARGEAIAIGTNVTQTSVAAEIAALS